MWAGVLIQPLLVVLSTSGEIRYVVPTFTFIAFAGVMALSSKIKKEPGVGAGIFLSATLILAAGEGAITCFHAHVKSHWGAQPLFAGLEPVSRFLRKQLAEENLEKHRILCQQLSHIRYHLALYSGMRLCPALGDLSKLLPDTTSEAIASGKIKGTVSPAVLLQGAKIKGCVSDKVSTLWLVGLSNDPRVTGLAKWCGAAPLAEFPHPYGNGLKWLVYRLGPKL